MIKTARLLAPLTLLASLACTSATSPGATSTSGAGPGSMASATSPGSSGPLGSRKGRVVSEAALSKVCHAEHVDASSKVFVAVDAQGDPWRLEVTPSKDIADLGNLIFDLEGVLLGSATGGEFPWDDKAAMAIEHARVDKLMDGAVVPEDARPIDCGTSGASR